MADMMQFLNIYPKTIEDVASTCEQAMLDAGFNTREVDDMFEYVKQCFYDGDGMDYSDVTNSIISNFYGYTKEKLEEKLNTEVSYYVNCDDSHLYINGEEYFEGDDLIENILILNVDIVETKETFRNGKPAVECTLDIHDDYECDFIYCSGILDELNKIAPDTFGPNSLAADELYSYVVNHYGVNLDMIAILQDNDISYAISFSDKIQISNVNDCGIDLFIPIERKFLEYDDDITEKLKIAISRDIDVSDLNKDSQDIIKSIIKDKPRIYERS